MNNNVADEQLNRVPSQEKSARRVAFSDSLPKHRSTSCHGTVNDFCPRLFACCAWICVTVFGIILSILILGVIFMSFLQSGLPEISVRMLDFSELAIRNSTNQQNSDDALLDAKVAMTIEMRNKNEKMELSYGNIAVNLASEDVKLGKTVISGFSHSPGNVTVLNLKLNVAGDSTDRENALQLQDDEKKVEMDVLVTMDGTIGFHLGFFNLYNVPIHVACDFQQLLLLYRVNEPPCNIRMFPTK